MQYFAFLTFLVILWNLERTVGNDQLSSPENKNDDPQNSEQEVPKDYFWSFELNAENEQPEGTNNGMQNDQPGTVTNDWIMGDNESSYLDEDDDDDICQNETNAEMVDYVIKVLLRTEDDSESINDNKNPDAIEDMAEFYSILKKVDAKNQDNGAKLPNTGISFSDIIAYYSEPEKLADIAIEDTETDNETSNIMKISSIYKPQEFTAANNTSAENEDIGKQLTETDLFGYQLFVDVYLQQLVECSISTTNVTKIMALPNDIFEAIDLVYNEIMNKLN